MHCGNSREDGHNILKCPKDGGQANRPKKKSKEIQDGGTQNGYDGESSQPMSQSQPMSESQNPFFGRIPDDETEDRQAWCRFRKVQDKFVFIRF
ncbi:unnamed protein product [Arabis nemorensis]|uniref:Uncharacterized protein n=1 Tax=Arabis nemorensis TaxID=586526 RepID=A0A565ASI1_9BRAS|nr:unnamed protein product [Arabis nemorensis]